MHYVLTLCGCDDHLPERALAALRRVQGLTVVDSFAATVLVQFDGEAAALKRQLPGWAVQPETWLRPSAPA